MMPGSETIVLTGRMKEPTRIAQAEVAGHPWYVSRRFNTGNYKEIEYLHGDGVWRVETKHEGRFTGLYQNRDEALSAIAFFESLEPQPTPPKVRAPKVKQEPPPPPPPVAEEPPAVVADPKVIGANPNWRALDRLQALVDKHSGSAHQETKVDKTTKTTKATKKKPT